MILRDLPEQTSNRPWGYWRSQVLAAHNISPMSLLRLLELRKAFHQGSPVDGEAGRCRHIGQSGRGEDPTQLLLQRLVGP